MRADFLEINGFINRASIQVILAQKPHRLSDMFGNIISKKFEDQLDQNEHILSFTPQELALIKLQTNASSQEELKDLLTKELNHYIQTQLELSEKEKQELLWKDLEAILFLSELMGVNPEPALQKMLVLLCTHIGCASASIFGIPDGFTLELLASLGESDPNLASIAGIATTTKKLYVAKSPGKENVPGSILCQPILFGNTVVGVLNISNKISTDFSEQDLFLLQKFSRTAAHILQKSFMEKRMLSFEKTSDNLGKYLSSKVVKNVKKVDSIELGGVEKKVVCLFSDIRSFTTITEGIPPGTLVNLLNFYFERMSAVIDKYEGTIDKLVGDLIMVVWNMPHDQPEPELLAMKTAIEMQKEMTRHIASEWAKHGVTKIGCGIGVNAGTAVIGNLGSSRFMNYTVIGDTINTAQRLEAKAGAGEIWMAESIFPLVEGKIERPIRKENGIKLKGKTKEVNAYVYRPLAY